MTRDEWLHHRERVHSRDKAVMILDSPLVPGTATTGMDGNNEAARIAVLNQAGQYRAADVIAGRCRDEGPYSKVAQALPHDRPLTDLLRACHTAVSTSLPPAMSRMLTSGLRFRESCRRLPHIPRIFISRRSICWVAVNGLLSASPDTPSGTRPGGQPHRPPILAASLRFLRERGGATLP